MSNIDKSREGKLEAEISRMSGIRKMWSVALIAAMILWWNQKAEWKRLSWVTSQKEAINLLKSQWKLLPNVPTDFTHFWNFYRNVSIFLRNDFPYASKRQRYETDNLRDVDGKDIEIDNDLDSCMFLNETVYKSNLDKIIPIIIDTQIDTINAANWEYERVDWDNSRSFIWWIPNKESITYKSWKWVNFGSHMNAMADVLIAKKDNFVESDYDAWLDVRVWKEEVWIRPWKVRLYTTCPALWGEDVSKYALKYIYDEAKNNPDKKYILSCSRSWWDTFVNNWFTTLGTLDNVIIFVARNNKDMNENNTTSYAANPNTIEVWYVQSPWLTRVDDETLKFSFANKEKDRVVNMESSQTGKMKWDGFCTLGQWSTSEATALMTGMAANLRAQNPNWTKDEVISMLKRDTYKSGEYQYDANGWNERTGWGIVQPWKTMKENIFPSIPTKKNNEWKYYFKVSNFPAEYTIQWEWVSKDEIWYFVDLNSMEPGKYNYTFVGKCVYDGEGTEWQWAWTYDFPITRELVVDPSTDTVDLLLQNWLSAINLFPNPVNNILNINLPYENVSIKIFNIAGQLCLESELYSQNNQIDLSSLKSWVYLVNITDDKWNKRTEKIVKN